MQVPLVDLATPTTRRVATGRPDGEGREDRTVQHGLGCTAFWPGSHRHPEAVHLGAAAARTRLRYIVLHVHIERLCCWL